MLLYIAIATLVFSLSIVLAFTSGKSAAQAEMEAVLGQIKKYDDLEAPPASPAPHAPPDTIVSYARPATRLPVHLRLDLG